MHCQKELNRIPPDVVPELLGNMWVLVEGLSYNTQWLLKGWVTIHSPQVSSQSSMRLLIRVLISCLLHGASFSLFFCSIFSQLEAALWRMILVVLEKLLCAHPHTRSSQWGCLGQENCHGEMLKLLLTHHDPSWNQASHAWELTAQWGTHE